MRSHQGALVLVLVLLAIALVPYAVQRLGVAAGERMASTSPAATLFTAFVAAVALVTLILARKRRIIV